MLTILQLVGWVKPNIIKMVSMAGLCLSVGESRKLEPYSEGMSLTEPMNFSQHEKFMFKPHDYIKKIWTTVLNLFYIICRRGDLNPHRSLHTPLKRARLPFRHYDLFNF